MDGTAQVELLHKRILAWRINGLTWRSDGLHSMPTVAHDQLLRHVVYPRARKVCRVQQAPAKQFEGLLSVILTTCFVFLALGSWWLMGPAPLDGEDGVWRKTCGWTCPVGVGRPMFRIHIP